MITITRQLASQLRNLLRRMRLQWRAPHQSLPVLFLASEDGLQIRAVNHRVALEFHQPGHLAPEQFVLPVEALAACEGKGDAPIQFEYKPDESVEVRWEERGVPMVRHFLNCREPLQEKWPRPPQRFSTNDQPLLTALQAAAELVDRDPGVRFALDAALLQGKTGKIAATDTRQALVIRGGFQFPWDDDVLLVPSNVFGFTGFPSDSRIEIGATDTHVCLWIRPWTLYLERIKDRRFPDVEGACPPPANVKTRVQIAPEDRDFLLKSLKGLPAREAEDSPVTLDCNGHFAIRAQVPGETPVIELVLSRSQVSGKPVRFNTNRRYLHQALSLGFSELHVTDANTPLAFADERRTYFWVGLGPANALKRSRQCVRIDSASSASRSQQHLSSPTPTPHQSPERRSPMKRTANGNGNPPHDDASCNDGTAGGTTSEATDGRAEPSLANGSAQSTGSQDGSPQDATVIDPVAAAEALQGDLRTALASTSRLLQALRRNRKQSRFIENTLQSLRQLQGV